MIIYFLEGYLFFQIQTKVLWIKAYVWDLIQKSPDGQEEYISNKVGHILIDVEADNMWGSVLLLSLLII